jgi:hypothetical protein
MNSGYMSPYDRSQGRKRLWSAAVTSIVVEVLRFRLHPDQYVGTWQLTVAVCVFANIVYHRWTLPDTHPKTLVSASFSEMSLPPLYQTTQQLCATVAGACWLFLQQNITGLELHS